MVQVGCFLPSYAASRPIQAEDLLHFAREAEERGYAHVWAGDHYLWNVGILSPMTTLAAVAAVTDRVRLGTGVYLMNLRHPSVTAKDVASVDVLSGGRLILGVGIGGDNPDEYRALGADPSARGSQLDENMAAVLSLLRQDGTAFEGRHISIPAFRMEPPPVQQPVPVWVGGRAPVVVERAARSGQGWFPVWVSAARIASAWKTIEEIRGTRDDFRVALNIFTTLDSSRESAGAAMAAHLDNAYALPFEKFERYSAFGTPDDLVASLMPFVEAGVTDLVLNIAGPDTLGQAQQIAEDVLPRLA